MNTLLQEALDHLETVRKRMLTKEHVCEIALATIDHFSDDYSITARVWDDGTWVSMDVILEDARDIAKIMRFVRKLGGKAYRPKKPYDLTGGGLRCFPMGPIAIYLGVTGEKCKYVKVGTKTKDVYELQCGGEPLGDIQDEEESNAAGESDGDRTPEVGRPTATAASASLTETEG